MKLATVTIFILLSACAQPAPEQVVQNEPACSSQQRVVDRNYAASRQTVTFYGDVLPALESRVSGYKFNCTTCHSEYRRPEFLLQGQEINKMIAAIRAEGAAFMPRIGDRLPDNYLMMLKRWGENPVIGEKEEFQKRSLELKRLGEQNEGKRNDGC